MGMAAARARHLRHLRRDALSPEGAAERRARAAREDREENWIPLFDETGVPLYPELMAELDVIKRERIGGLMLTRDWGERSPWPTGDRNRSHAHEPQGEGDHPRRRVARRADLHSFRHGGFTEAADADLSDAEMQSAGRHKSAKVLPTYAKRTMKQVAEGRRSGGRREQKQTICQNEQQPACQNDGIET